MTRLRLPGRFAAAIFDVDGLLVDTEDRWAAAEAELLARHGHEYSDDDAAATLGRSVDASIAIYGRRIGLPDAALPALRSELLAIFAAGAASVTPQPGSADLLARLHGRLRLGVASSSPRQTVEALLGATSLLEMFEVVVTADDVSEHKPSPAPYLLACRLLGVQPTDALAFEDSGPGIRSARRAGLYCVAVPSPGADVADADLVLGSLGEVLVDDPVPR